jgi:hypothetical protein
MKNFGFIPPRERIGFWKGKKLSDETKRKLSELNKGKKQSSRTINKRIEKLRGRKRTVEQKSRISNSKKGKKCPWAKNNPQVFKKDSIPWNKGKKGIHLSPKSEFKKGVVYSFKRNWKGGFTPLINMIRNCFKYRQWRSDIFTRDDFTCQRCGVRSGNGKTIYLEAHHPKMLSTIFYENKITTREQALNFEELWNINNGITLCRECHNKTKNGGRKKKN